MKKVLSALLVVMLVLTSVFALAEELPSKTTTDMTVITSIVPQDEAAGTVLIEIVEAGEQVTALLAKVVETVVAGEIKPVELYTEETQAAVAEKVEDAAALELNEIVACDVLAYAEENGDVVVNISFVTLYSTEQTLVAVATAYKGEEVKEYVLDAVACEDGTVNVTFIAEYMKEMLDADEIALAILNTK